MNTKMPIKKQRVLHALTEGMTAPEASRKYGVKLPTVYYWKAQTLKKTITTNQESRPTLTDKDLHDYLTRKIENYKTKIDSLESVLRTFA